MPNDQYDSKNTVVATFNSTSDVDNFFNQYNHNNGYNGLKLGQKIQMRTRNMPTFPDNTYSSWYIAGFDCEYNHTASDGSVRNNGYGICLISARDLMIDGSYYVKWHSSYSSDTPYISSLMHTSTMAYVANNLMGILGSHLINRNVLLSSNRDSTGAANGYTWTRSYATCLSVHQLFGYGLSDSNIATKYDSGEANYFIPLYNYQNYFKGLGSISDRGYWTRAVSSQTWGNISFVNPHWNASSGSNLTWMILSDELATTPIHLIAMIYIR